MLFNNSANTWWHLEIQMGVEKNKAILTLTGDNMLLEAELLDLEKRLKSLGYSIPENIEIEQCGVAILRFCLSKALRTKELSNNSKGGNNG